MKKTAVMLVAIFTLLVSGYPNAAHAEEANVQEEIIYDILVDRFNNGDTANDDQVRINEPNTYHGGDIEGIIAKLPTINELGFTTISLSPIMENASDSFQGYRVENFYEVEEQFGSMDDLRKLINEAHERDIKVMMEFVTNYVSSNHPMVNDPEKEDWINEGAMMPDNTENVAVLNQENPEVEAFLLDVASYWIEETDLDGFKLHAANEANGDFLKNFTAHIKDLKEEFYLIADTLNSDEDKSSLIENEDIAAIENRKIHKVMSDVFSQVGNPVSDIYEAWEESGNKSGLLYVDNKDMKRFTQKFAENGRSHISTWKLALTYMYTSPGVPLVYQGSEIPMYGADATEAKSLVEFNSGDPDLKEFNDRISSLRSKFPALQYGDFEMVGTEGAMSVFKRTFEDETIYIALNNSAETNSVILSESEIKEGKQLKGLLGDETVRANENGEFRIGLSRESVDVYVVEEDTGLNWGFIGFVGGIFILFIGFIVILSRKQKKKA